MDYSFFMASYANCGKLQKRVLYSICALLFADKYNIAFHNHSLYFAILSNQRFNETPIFYETRVTFAF